MHVLLRPSLAVMLLLLLVEIQLDYSTRPRATRHLVSLECWLKLEKNSLISHVPASCLKKPTEMPKVSALFCVTQIDDLLLEFRSVKRLFLFVAHKEPKSCPHINARISFAEEMLFCVAVSLLRMLRLSTTTRT